MSLSPGIGRWASRLKPWNRDARASSRKRRCYRALMPIAFEWRGVATSRELNHLHAEAFETEVFDDDAWPWVDLLERHSLGWVVAREDETLVGFVNVLWDGLVHAWIQDTMVADAARHRGVATQLVQVARDAARDAGCEWLHVDFDRHLRPFYVDACGFAPTDAGLIALQEEASVSEPKGWEERLATLWASIDGHTETSFVARMDELVAELSEGSAIAAYERGSAFDSTGQADLAVPLYRQALAAGLPPDRRRRAIIQLASSLRALGEIQESVTLLTTERAAGSDELDDAVDAFLALSQADAGR
jgi:GNAT superfamily N-acetyltransferase